MQWASYIRGTAGQDSLSGLKVPTSPSLALAVAMGSLGLLDPRGAGDKWDSRKVCPLELDFVCCMSVEPLWGNTTLLGTKRTARFETKIARWPAWTHVKCRSIWPHLCLPLLGRWTCKACGRRLSFWCSVSSSLKHNPLTWNLRKRYQDIPRYTHYIPRHPMTVAAWLRFSQCDRSELPMEVFFQRMCDLECHLVGLQFCKVLFERWLAHILDHLKLLGSSSLSDSQCRNLAIPSP